MNTSIKYPFLLTLSICLMASSTLLSSNKLNNTYEGITYSIEASEADILIRKKLAEHDIEPAYICSDEVFIRRVFLDTTGTLPTIQEFQGFYIDESLDKRSVLIDQLLKRPEFTDYWTMKWCNLLRVKAEFPINLWPNAVQAYYRWIHDAVGSNMPFDQFARELLTSSGSNFRKPAVNFYRAVIEKKPETIAAAVALTFMGTRIEHWDEKTRKQFSALFSRVAYKPTDEWKEEIVHLDPKQYKAFDVVFPDGTEGRVAAGEDPRKVFANWLIKAENQWFAKNIVNRAWSWLMGHGIIHEPDDIRMDNPASNPELLRHLEKSFIDSKYDMKQLFRTILNSRTYQQSSIPRSDDPKAKELFAHYSIRRLDAEVLIDAINNLGRLQEHYQSPIPEPFTFVPENQRTVMLADGSISSQFLELFGRPSRDTGLESERNNEPSSAQRLFLLNSSKIHNTISKSPYLRKMISQYAKKPKELVNAIYLSILTRYPNENEIEVAKKYLQKSSNSGNTEKNKKQNKNKRLQFVKAIEDLIWALLNSKEFLYQH